MNDKLNATKDDVLLDMWHERRVHIRENIIGIGKEISYSLCQRYEFKPL